MNEKELLNRIKDSMDDVTPPASLQPDAIENMLNRQKRNVQTAQKNGKSRTFLRQAARYGSIAAVFVLSITSLWQAYRISELRREVELANFEIELPDHILEDYEDETEISNTVVPENTVAADTLSAMKKTAVTASEQSETAASDSSTDQTADIEATSAPEWSEDSLTYADSYESIYNALREHFYYEYDYVSGSAEYEYEEAAVDLAVTTDSDTGGTTFYSASGSTRSNIKFTSESGSKDFSETNKQETGVDEADIVKTDGEYIYILRTDGSLAILRAKGADSSVVSITPLPNQENGMIQELYLDGDFLNVLTSETVSELNEENEFYYTSTTRQTVVYTYDITNRSAPELKGTVTQEGNYSDSRKVGNHLYLFTKYYPDVCGTYEESTIIPRLNGQKAEASAFYLPDYLDSNTYLVISSLDITSPTEILDSKILVSGASQFYVSTENIYIANTLWNPSDSSERTEITKFHYEDGIITGVAAGNVDGYLNDPFSLNEHNGNLRVVTTYYGRQDNEELYDEYNGLFIFNEAMKQIGSIRDLAQGETIRSARFFGDTGYFVTFRQTDPLFSVDLSDPTNPVILGELKISGFSSYLHFYGENLLLGIGYEADEETGITTGLKLSMFDISDPSHVTEQHRYLIPGITWCPAIEDYKSILVEPEKNVIGFYCDNRYLTFSYDPENGFAQELIYDFFSDMLTGEAEYDSMRGLFIEDTLYLAGNSFLISFDMNDAFARTGILKFA